MRSYRTKVAEAVTLPERDEREAALASAGYNVFNLDAADVFVDLLTDSGTGAMSVDQWSGLIRGDEAYAGSASFERFEAAVQEVMGFEYVVPAHQGRGAEHLLYGAILDEGDIAVNNTHFDTTRAHVSEAGAEPIDCPATPLDELDAPGSFKGNFSIERAREAVAEAGADRLGCVIATITNNSAAGQPVSVANLEAAGAFAAEHDVPFVIDACRFAENAYFNAEEGDDVAAIAREQFAAADAVVMSGKKDALVNMGGFVAVRDEALYQQLRQRCILFEGFPTYGGLSGRDLEAMAVGLREAVERPYLHHRVEQIQSLADRLDDVGVPVVQPAGGHAVYVDAGALYSQLSPDVFPGQALVCALYREGGIRAAELGRFAFPGTDRPDFVRLAVPRRMYHDEHLDHVVDTFETIVATAEDESGLEIVDSPGRPALRHFSARLAPIDD